MTPIRTVDSYAARYATDEALVASARLGDSGAYDELVQRHYAQCLRTARLMLRHDSDAQDAVQEVFLRVQRALDRYESRDRFGGWLYLILTNHCRNAIRARRNREARFPLDPEEDVLSIGRWDPEPIDWRLERALNELTPLLREALTMRFQDGLGYEEMSGRVGASVSALKMRVARGCQEMRVILGDLNARTLD